MSDYLLISDAAKEVKVESHVLRYWEEELHLPIKRNELGHRYYTREDVERFKQIKSMKERGLQLKAIKMILRDGRLDVLPQEDEGGKSIQESEAGQAVSVKENRTGQSVCAKENGTGQSACAKENGTGQSACAKENGTGQSACAKENGTGHSACTKEKGNEKSAGVNAGGKAQAVGVNAQDDFQEQSDSSMVMDIAGHHSREDSVTAESREEKARRLQWLLQQMIRETLRENNQELSREIRESIVKELNYQFRTQEEREEERQQKREQRDEEYYRRMDELLRKKSKRAFGVVSGRRSEARDLKEKNRRNKEIARNEKEKMQCEAETKEQMKDQTKNQTKEQTKDHKKEQKMAKKKRHFSF